MHINFLNIVKLCNLGVRSGARSNLKVEWTGRKIWMCPSTFLRCHSMWEGTTENRAARPRDESLASSLTMRRVI